MKEDINLLDHFLIIGLDERYLYDKEIKYNPVTLVDVIPSSEKIPKGFEPIKTTHVGNHANLSDGNNDDFYLVYSREKNSNPIFHLDVCDSYSNVEKDTWIRLMPMKDEKSNIYKSIFYSRNQTNGENPIEEISIIEIENKNDDFKSETIKNFFSNKKSDNYFQEKEKFEIVEKNIYFGNEKKELFLLIKRMNNSIFDRPLKSKIEFSISLSSLFDSFIGPNIFGSINNNKNNGDNTNINEINFDADTNCDTDVETQNKLEKDLVLNENEFPINEKIVYFALPEGSFLFKKINKKFNYKIFQNVLTDQNGREIYLVSLIFLKSVNDSKLMEKLKRLKKENIAKENETCRYFENKALVLLSRIPAYDFMTKLLINLYEHFITHQSKSDSNFSNGFIDYNFDCIDKDETKIDIVNVLFPLLFYKLRKRNNIQITYPKFHLEPLSKSSKNSIDNLKLNKGLNNNRSDESSKDNIVLNFPSALSFPFQGLSNFSLIFVLASLRNILWLMQFVLLEKKVLICSSDPSVLTSVLEQLRFLLFPFEWQFTYIPFLTENMLIVLESPFPLLAGISTENLLKVSFTNLSRSLYNYKPKSADVYNQNNNESKGLSENENQLSSDRTFSNQKSSYKNETNSFDCDLVIYDLDLDSINFLHLENFQNSFSLSSSYNNSNNKEREDSEQIQSSTNISKDRELKFVYENIFSDYYRELAEDLRFGGLFYDFNKGTLEEIIDFNATSCRAAFLRLFVNFLGPKYINFLKFPLSESLGGGDNDDNSSDISDSENNENSNSITNDFRSTNFKLSEMIDLKSYKKYRRKEMKRRVKKVNESFHSKLKIKKTRKINNLDSFFEKFFDSEIFYRFVSSNSLYKVENFFYFADHNVMNFFKTYCFQETKRGRNFIKEISEKEDVYLNVNTLKLDSLLKEILKDNISSREEKKIKSLLSLLNDEERNKTEKHKVEVSLQSVFKLLRSVMNDREIVSKLAELTLVKPNRLVRYLVFSKSSSEALSKHIEIKEEIYNSKYRESKRKSIDYLSKFNDGEYFNTYSDHSNNRAKRKSSVQLDFTKISLNETCSNSYSHSCSDKDKNKNQCKSKSEMEENVTKNSKKVFLNGCKLLLLRSTEILYQPNKILLNKKKSLDIKDLRKLEKNKRDREKVNKTETKRYLFFNKLNFNSYLNGVINIESHLDFLRTLFLKSEPFYNRLTDNKNNNNKLSLEVSSNSVDLVDKNVSHNVVKVFTWRNDFFNYIVSLYILFVGSKSSMNEFELNYTLFPKVHLVFREFQTKLNSTGNVFVFHVFLGICLKLFKQQEANEVVGMMRKSEVKLLTSVYRRSSLILNPSFHQSVSSTSSENKSKEREIKNELRNENSNSNSNIETDSNIITASPSKFKISDINFSSLKFDLKHICKCASILNKNTILFSFKFIQNSVLVECPNCLTEFMPKLKVKFKTVSKSLNSNNDINNLYMMETFLLPINIVLEELFEIIIKGHDYIESDISASSNNDNTKVSRKTKEGYEKSNVCSLFENINYLVNTLVHNNLNFSFLFRNRPQVFWSVLFYFDYLKLEINVFPEFLNTDKQLGELISDTDLREKDENCSKVLDNVTVELEKIREALKKKNLEGAILLALSLRKIYSNINLETENDKLNFENLHRSLWKLLLDLNALEYLECDRESFNEIYCKFLRELHHELSSEVKYKDRFLDLGEKYLNFCLNKIIL